MNSHYLTPCKKHGPIHIKRDDKFSVGGATGGKARALMSFILNNEHHTYITAGSRQSMQCRVVSTLCDFLEKSCVIVMPKGEKTEAILEIEKHKKTALIRANAGYNSVIISTAKKLSEGNKAVYVPFGMEFAANIRLTAAQVNNIPKEVDTIIVPIGSGMTFCGIAQGLEDLGRQGKVKLVGVAVGKDPTKTLNKWLPPFYRNYAVIISPIPYSKAIKENLYGVDLDSIYEAKCVPVIQSAVTQGKKVCFWVVGKNN